MQQVYGKQTEIENQKKQLKLEVILITSNMNKLYNIKT